MKVWTGAMAAAVLGLTMAAGAQQPPAPSQPPTEGHGGPPPPGTQAPARPAGPQGGFPQGPARFPAHQRPPVDPAVLERGRGIYVGSCGACHGVDARGGQLGGPNLLRSQLVLSDQDAELIAPVVKNGRPGTLMLPLPIADADIKAIAAYLHGLQAQGTNQGGPPPGPPVELNILLGDANAGEKYFAAKCSTCHSAAADLQGLATRVPDPKTLQNLWVSGGRAAGPRRGGGRPASASSMPTVTVTLPSGEKVEGRLLRLDDFLVTVGQADGTARTVRRDGDVPTVEVKDPLDGHRDLLSVLSDANMHDVTAYLATLK
jgi:cytochrome c oxidase cbb3-type subunit III